MPLGHLVGRGDEPLTVRGLNSQPVGVVRLPALQSRQLLPAAAHLRFVRGKQKVAAGGAHIKFQLSQVSVSHIVFLQISGQESGHVDPQHIRQQGQGGKVRASAARITQLMSPQCDGK